MKNVNELNRTAVFLLGCAALAAKDNRAGLDYCQDKRDEMHLHHGLRYVAGISSRGEGAKGPVEGRSLRRNGCACPGSCCSVQFIKLNHTSMISYKNSLCSLCALMFASILVAANRYHHHHNG